MTGPLGPMDDDGVVDLLRAAGHGGPEPSSDDVSRAITHGRRIRRRRQTTQILGTGLAMVAVLGVGITTVGALDDGKDGTTVTASGDDAPATPVPTVVLAGKYLTEDLGEGWLNTGTSAMLDPKSELAALLPNGDYRAEGTASLIDRAAYEAVCEKQAGRNTCERVETSDGNTIWLWDWADRDLTRSELKGEASAYRVIGADRYVLITIAVVGTDVSAPERESHIDTVSAWFASQEGGLRKAVTDERIENSLLAESAQRAGVRSPVRA